MTGVQTCALPISGSFGGRITVFDSLEVVNGSNISFTNISLNLKDVKNWKFDTASSISDIRVNDFAGDSLEVAVASGWNESDSTIMTAYRASAFDGFDSLADVTLGGEQAAWDGTEACYASTSYKLFIEDKYLKFGKLA